MKFMVVLSAALVVASAQRRYSARPEAQPQPQQQQLINDDQQVAEQNYNNYQQQQQQQDYRQPPKQQDQDYRQQQQSQEYRQQQQAQEYRQQQQAQQYRQQQPERQSKPVEDFRPKTSLETTTFIPIIRFDKEQGTDGSYKTAYETGNNIQAQEQGFLKNFGEDQNALVQQGTYSYTAPDGQVITVEYTADEYGFRVKGDHIPTPPPVSPEIQAGLDLIYAGIKANEERSALEAKNNPEAHQANQEKAALDYKGFYYPQ